MVEGRKDQDGAAQLHAAASECGESEAQGAPKACSADVSGGPSAAETIAASNASFEPAALREPPKPAYAALDLGTNNCRLLVARPSRRGFKVIDAFSRIIRLGEGVSATGRLSQPAIERTIDALRVCAAKMDRNKVERAGLIATEACRLACNADEFLA